MTVYAAVPGSAITYKIHFRLTGSVSAAMARGKNTAIYRGPLSSQLAPYLSGSNADATKEQSKAVLQSCFALFQLGVSIALEKFDAPEDAEDDAEEAAAVEAEAVEVKVTAEAETVEVAADAACADDSDKEAGKSEPAE